MRISRKQLQQNSSHSFVLLFFALICALALAGCGGGGGGGQQMSGGGDGQQMPGGGDGQQMPGGGDGQQMPGDGSGSGGDTPATNTPSEIVSQIFSRANDYSWSDFVIISSGLVIASPVDLGVPDEIYVETYNTERPSGTNLTIGRQQISFDDTLYQGFSFEDGLFNRLGMWGSHHFQEIYQISGNVVDLNGVTDFGSVGQANSTGYLTGNNPVQGSATWTGFATVLDSNMPRNLGIATAQINVDFTDMTADAMFSDFEDTSLSPINFNNMAIHNGRFNYDQNSNTLDGAFYGPNQEEAGGTFSYYPEGLDDSLADRALIGGFSAERGQ